MKRFSYSGIAAAALVAAALMTARVYAAAPTSDCTDRVTGGGWIVPEGSQFANFGAGGGLLQGNLWGYLNYLDHTADLHVTAQDVVAYCIACTNSVTAQCRRITYFPATVNGVDGYTVIVQVCDAGEPGVEDSFAICIPDLGYCAGGVLGGDNKPSGGNIQLHNADPDCEGAIPVCEELVECPCFVCPP